MSARTWTHAGITFRMPDYRTAIRLSKAMAAAPRASTLEEQIDALPLWAEVVCCCLPDLTCPDPVAHLADDLGWSLIEMISAGAACITEINGRLYATMDGAIKQRDFSTPRTAAPSTTS